MGYYNAILICVIQYSCLIKNTIDSCVLSGDMALVWGTVLNDPWNCIWKCDTEVSMWPNREENERKERERDRTCCWRKSMAKTWIIHPKLIHQDLSRKSQGRKDLPARWKNGENENSRRPKSCTVDNWWARLC